MSWCHMIGRLSFFLKMRKQTKNDILAASWLIFHCTKALRGSVCSVEKQENK